MKKVIGMILFICAASIGYCAGVVLGLIAAARCSTKYPDEWSKDSVENIKDAFKK